MENPALLIPIAGILIIFIVAIIGMIRCDHRWVIQDSFRINYQKGYTKQAYVLRCTKCGNLKKKEF